MRFIGDIHGDIYGAYSKAVRGCQESIQIGDFGRGFLAKDAKELVDSFHRDNPRHRFIRGNHDDPADCVNAPGWIADGSYDSDRQIMYVGGAWSLDWEDRTPGRSWWPDEELSLCELERIRASYVYLKPKVMVTHDCPRRVATELFFRPPFDTSNKFSTRTSEAFDAMLRDHQPDLWVFGHWHETQRIKIGKTEFICVDQNTWIDINL